MAFRKPFRAVLIKEGVAHRHRRESAAKRQLIFTGAKWSTIAIVIGGMIGFLTSKGEDGQRRGYSLISRIAIRDSHSEASPPEALYFEYCDQARAAGRAPIYEGQPGYRRELDADGDGIACEPYPR